jgi:hypothetical protein
MDRDIYEINRAFLVKAREFALSHGDHRAHYVMGISMDLAAFLRRISLNQLNVLASADVTCFSLRIPASLLRQVEATTTPEGLDALGKYQLIAGAVRRDSHEN